VVTEGLICLQSKDAPPDRISLVPDQFISPAPIPNAIQDVIEVNLETDFAPSAINDCLFRKTPRFLNGPKNPILEPNLSADAFIKSIILAANELDNSYLCIRGPPGAGKTFTARKVIGDLIAKGKRIGISFNSHKAIINLMDGVSDHLIENDITGKLIKIRSNDEGPLNYKLLTTNILLNDLQMSVIHINTALGNHMNKFLQLELSEENYGDHRVGVTGETRDAGYDEGNRKTIDVLSTTLDNIVDLRKLDAGMVWMDAQGYEGFILQGASRVLEAGLTLVTEFWPYGMDRANCFKNFKMALLKSRFTTIYDLNRPQHILKLNEASLNSLYSLYKDSKKNGSTDLVFI